MSVEVTTEGLQNTGAAAAALADAQWAVAAGSADAITAAYTPANVGLTDGLLLAFRASAANATATPTFAPDGLTAHTITKKGGTALDPGDIPAALVEVFVRYNLASTRWELVNRYPHRGGTVEWAVAAGSADAITAAYSPPTLALTDGMIRYFRASAANATTTPTFAPDGLTAHTITRKGGTALRAGDIPAANFEAIVRYNLANTRWELLNPQEGARDSSYEIGTGSNGTSAQTWFPGTSKTFALAAGGKYRFRGLLSLTRAAGTTSHTTSLLFGGSATFTALFWSVSASTGDAAALNSSNTHIANAASAIVVKAASTSATEVAWFWVEGALVVNAAGTLIPQFQYSAAPGGAPTVSAEFEIDQII